LPKFDSNFVEDSLRMIAIDFSYFDKSIFEDFSEKEKISWYRDFLSGEMSARDFVSFVVGLKDGGDSFFNYIEEIGSDKDAIDKEISRFPEIKSSLISECLDCGFVAFRSRFWQKQIILDINGRPILRLQCPECSGYKVCLVGKEEASSGAEEDPEPGLEDSLLHSLALMALDKRYTEVQYK